MGYKLLLAILILTGCFYFKGNINKTYRIDTLNFNDGTYQISFYKKNILDSIIIRNTYVKSGVSGSMNKYQTYIHSTTLVFPGPYRYTDSLIAYIFTSFKDYNYRFQLIIMQEEIQLDSISNISTPFYKLNINQYIYPLNKRFKIKVLSSEGQYIASFKIIGKDSIFSLVDFKKELIFSGKSQNK